MHTASIREIHIERDAPAITELLRETQPTAVINVASYVHRIRTVPEHARLRQWVAEVEGHVVAHADCWLTLFAEQSGSGELQLAVRGDQRRRGIASALYDVGFEYLQTIDVDRILTSFHENDAGVAFAEARGFLPVRAETESELDPRAVSGCPAGDVRAVSSVDPRLAYEIDIEATYDMPATEPFSGMSYEEWEDHVLRHPLFTAEGSFVVFDGGEAAAVSLLTVDHDTGRASSLFTGTRAAYRGRGHALTAKLASIEWAAANGVTKLVTYNDATNAPMLAINRRLGYAPSGRRVEMLKALGSRSEPDSVSAEPDS
jgi:GNAT superfamily N-acetyltransferase